MRFPKALCELALAHFEVVDGELLTGLCRISSIYCAMTLPQGAEG